MQNADFEQRAIALGESFANSVELGETLLAAQQAWAAAVGGAGGTNSSTALIERLCDQPFALSRTYDDF
ncbi:hypothetical protein PV762_08880 [Mitsuaria sp. CC2]|uniref:hypothetical protein n=1 Tax=Mitsuaria sp. CC2 TaxID=3029186 RepID=UPI003B8B5A78